MFFPKDRLYPLLQCQEVCLGSGPPRLHRYFKEFWAWAQAQQGSPCPAVWFVIWPFITDSEQALIILTRPPSQLTQPGSAV